MKRFAEIIVCRQPIPQPRQRNTVGGRSYLPEDHPIHAFKAAVRWASLQVWQGRAPIESAVRISIEFVFRPSTAKGWIPGSPVTMRKFGDGDNLEKAVWDSMSKIVFADDCQIAEWSGRKRYIRDGEAEHVRIKLEWNQ